MSKMPDKLRLPITICCLICSLTLYSQIRIASPYSRFGIGDLSDNNNAWNNSLGQLGLALRSPYHVNYMNPASYTAFDSLSFVFEGGFNGELVTLKSNYQSVNRNYASLGYLLFGIPVTKWWKTSLGLVPFSDVGYSVANYEEFPESGTVVRLYQGSGGINRLFWGNAFQPFRNFSIGLNASYLFGSMIREAQVLFPDSLTALNFKELYYVSMNDLYFNFGAQYRAKIKNGLFLNMGIVFAPTLQMSASTDLISTTFLLASDGSESVRDTLVISEDYKGKISIPLMYGGGLALEKTDKWMVGLDFKWQNWEKFKAYELSDSLVNSWQINFGAEIVPKVDNFKNYLARIHYRLGFNYQQTYLRLRGDNLNEYCFSLGFGLPLRGMKTMLNLGAQVGLRGTTDQNLIRESYFKVVIGFSIYERWFIKRKYF